MALPPSLKEKLVDNYDEDADGPDREVELEKRVRGAQSRATNLGDDPDEEGDDETTNDNSHISVSEAMGVTDAGKTVSLKMAMKHGENSRLVQRDFGAKPCECNKCDYKSGGDQYSLLCEPMDLAPYGPGWVLFFDFNKFVVIVLFVSQVLYIGMASFTSSVDFSQERLQCNQLLTAYHTAQVLDRPQCVADWEPTIEMLRDRVNCSTFANFLRPSSCATNAANAGIWGPSRHLLPNAGFEDFSFCAQLLGKGDTWQEPDVPELTTAVQYPWVIWNYFACLFFTMVMCFLYRARQVSLVVQATTRSVNADDYAVLLENLNPRCKKEDDIKEFLYRVMGDELTELDEDHHPSIVRAVMVFNTRKIEPLLAQLKDLTKDFERAAGDYQKIRKNIPDTLVAARRYPKGHPKRKKQMKKEAARAEERARKADEEGQPLPESTTAKSFDTSQEEKEMTEEERQQEIIKERAKDVDVKVINHSLATYIEDLREKVSDIQRERAVTLTRILESLQEDLHVEAAFVTFRYPQTAQRVLAKLDLRRGEGTARTLLPNWVQRMFLPRQNRHTLYEEDDNHVVVASVPPEPSDLVWDSFSDPIWKRLVGYIIRWLVLLGLVGMTYLLVTRFQIHNGINNIFCKPDGKRDGYWEGLAQEYAPTIIAVIVQTANISFGFFLDAVPFGRPKTASYRRRLEFRYLVTMMFFNTVVMTFVLHAQWLDVLGDEGKACGGSRSRLIPDTNVERVDILDTAQDVFNALYSWIFAEASDGLCVNWYARGHLLDDVSAIIQTGIWFIPAVFVFPPTVIVAFFRKIFYQYTFDPQLSHMSQRELNAKFEAPVALLPVRLAYMLSMWCTAVTFMPIMPTAPLQVGVGLIIFYWANKYFFLRRARTPVYQEHKPVFSALVTMLVVLVPQPLIMAWLLSPSVENSEVLFDWHLRLCMGALTLLGVAGFSICRILDGKLNGKESPVAFCRRDHIMSQMTFKDFHQKFGRDALVRTCDECGANLGSLEDFKLLSGTQLKALKAMKLSPKHYVYHCKVCETYGDMEQLCGECGLEQRRGQAKKNMQQPYETASRFFPTNYWNNAPLTFLIKDKLKTHTKHLTEISKAETQWRSLTESKNMQGAEKAAEYMKVLLDHAGAFGLEFQPEHEPLVMQYTTDLVKEEQQVFLMSEEEAKALKENVDPESMRVMKRTPVSSGFVYPSWICDQLPEYGEGDTPVVVKMTRDKVSATRAMKDLLEEWNVFPDQDASQIRFQGTSTDWEQMVHESEFLEIYGANNRQCPTCKQRFETHEELLKHYDDAEDHDLGLPLD